MHSIVEEEYGRREDFSPKAPSRAETGPGDVIEKPQDFRPIEYPWVRSRGGFGAAVVWSSKLEERDLGEDAAYLD